MNDSEMSSVDLRCGTIHYRDIGSGPSLLFVHGVFTNGDLWNAVLPRMSARFRCIVPTLPLGAHADPMRPDADLSPRALAGALLELLDKLDVRNVTLVGNDTGGALCQLALAQSPQRVTGIVLTNCDAFEDFPPRALRPLYAATHLPGFFWLMARLLRVGVVRRLFFASVARSQPDPAFLASSLEPFVRDARIRRDVQKTMRAVSKRDTLAAAETFGSFDGSALIVWGTGDLFFSTKLANRLANTFRRAHLEVVSGARTFVPLDAPEVLADLLERFVAAPSFA